MPRELIRAIGTLKSSRCVNRGGNLLVESRELIQATGGVISGKLDELSLRIWQEQVVAPRRI